LSQHHLRQPPKRHHRHNNQSNSNQASILHITTLGSRTPHSLDVRQPPKDSNRDSTPAEVPWLSFTRMANPLRTSPTICRQGVGPPPRIFHFLTEGEAYQVNLPEIC